MKRSNGLQIPAPRAGSALEKPAEPHAPGAPVDYFRGAGGVAVDSRRVTLVVAGLAIVTLAALLIVLTASAVTQISRDSRLRHHGVPVDVTVTSCLGMASGTGITVSGYKCRGTFALSGRHYNEVIRGSGDLLTVGATLPAVTVPGDPTTLSAAKSVAASHPSWKAFITPAIVLLLLIVALLGWRLASRTQRARWRPPAGRAVRKAR